MGFRVLLVGVVAGLGLDLPSGSDLQHWMASGRGWVEQQVVAWTIERSAVGPVEAPAVDQVEAADAAPAGPKAVADDVFDTVVNRMKASFAAPAAPIVAPEAPRLATFEPVEPAEDLYPGLAFALNRRSDGLSEPTPMVERPAVEIPTTGNRLANAVKLTGAAVHAWMDLLRKGPALVAIEP